MSRPVKASTAIAKHDQFHETGKRMTMILHSRSVLTLLRVPQRHSSKVLCHNVAAKQENWEDLSRLPRLPL